MAIYVVIALTYFFTVGLIPYTEDSWFYSRNLVFYSNPGADNFTPIGTPAYFYLILDLFVSIFSDSEVVLLYVSYFAHCVLVCLGAVFIFKLFTNFTTPTISFVLGLIYMLVLMAVKLPSSFWSENLNIFLNTFMLYCINNILILKKKNLSFLLLFSVISSLYITNRIIPLVFIIALFMCLYVFKIRIFKKIAPSIIATTLIMLTLHMFFNYLRFDRFELTNSTARRLWNNTNHYADRFYADDKEYQKITKLIGSPQGLGKYQFCKKLEEIDYLVHKPEQAKFLCEGFFKELTLRNIKAKPFKWVSYNLVKIQKTFLNAVPQFGNYFPREKIQKIKNTQYEKRFNPLKVEEPFLPLIGDKVLDSSLKGILNLWNRFFKSFFLPSFIFIFGFALYKRYKRKEMDNPTIIMSTQVILSIIGWTFATYSAEEHNARYVIPLLPLFLVMFYATVKELKDLIALSIGRLQKLTNN